MEVHVPVGPIVAQGDDGSVRSFRDIEVRGVHSVPLDESVVEEMFHGLTSNSLENMGEDCKCAV